MGDLGNVEAKGGIVDVSPHLPRLRRRDGGSGSLKVMMKDKVIDIRPGQPTSILGRSVVLHAGTDDLGRGGKADSKTTGRRANCPFPPNFCVHRRGGGAPGLRHHRRLPQLRGQRHTRLCGPGPDSLLPPRLDL